MIRDGCYVKVDGDLASALRAFKKQTEAFGLQREMSKRACRVKPSAARTAKSLRARARVKKTAQRNQTQFKQNGEA